jgi:hypothetical protein
MFDRIKELRKQGKTPVIKLTPGLFIPTPKLPRGRPRKYPVGEHVASRYRGRRGKHRPYCMAKGCDRELRIHQEAACSEACESRIINDALLRLKQCRVTKEELLNLYGD